jgi:hypothetical protein
VPGRFHGDMPHWCTWLPSLLPEKRCRSIRSSP